MTMSNLAKNNSKIQILTDNGFESFDAVVCNGERQLFKTVLDDDSFILTTDDHKIYLDDETTKTVMSLFIGDKVKTTSGIKSVKNVIPTNDYSFVYDVVNAGKNKRFYADNILVSNCEFVSTEDTLIDGLFMTTLAPSHVKFWIDDIKWYEMPESNHIYGVAWDPAKGTGGDNAAIQVYDFTTMSQVAEWKSNSKPCDKQVEVLLKILYFLYQELYVNPEQIEEPAIYWTFESNAIGEAAFMAIKYTGLENFPGHLISDKVGRRGVKGLNTNNKNKVSACMLFKRLLESGKLTIKSKSLISEIKTFVSTGSGFEAKYGEHDDLVMSTILIIRILQRILNWDESLENKLSTGISIEDLTINPILNRDI